MNVTLHFSEIHSTLFSLNYENTKMVIFTSKHHLKTYGGCSLTTGDDRVSPADRIRNLRVQTNEAAKTAVNALVTSRLDYCNSLLHNIPLSQTARLQRVQNNAARLITRTSKHDHFTLVLKEQHLLPVES